jgi:energy-coupling factor transporter transmembrane protein EcfT
VKRSAFPPSPLPAELPGRAAHPGWTLLAFALLSLAVGLAWTPRQLLPALLGSLLYLVLPLPAFRAYRAVLAFLPLLLLLPLFHLLDWVGFAAEGVLPWRIEAAGLARGLQLSLRLGLWILISARSIERLHPAALLARLPRRPRLARMMLAPLLALSWLELILREAWLLERAWRARGGVRRLSGAHWPSLLLPLFRNVMARADILAEALEIRRFPERWAGAPSRERGAADLLPPLGALIVLLVTLWIRGGGA